METFGNAIDTCLKDASKKMIGYPNSDTMDITLWTKYNKNKNNDVERSITLVVSGRNHGDVCVFHNMKFAYYLKTPSRSFWHCFGEQNLPPYRVATLSND